MNKMIIKKTSTTEYVGVLVIFVAVFFKMVRDICVSHCKVPKAVATKKKENLWWNTIFSLAHSVGCSMLISYCFVKEHMNFTKDLINHYNQFSMVSLIFSCGYFVADTLDILLTRGFVSEVGILLHHFVMILGIAKGLITRQFINAICLSLIAEYSSMILHVRMLMKMSGCFIGEKRFIYTTVCAVNWISFGLIRFSTITYLYRFLYGALGRLNNHDKYFYFITGSLIAIINGYYFVVLFKSDFIKKQKKINECYFSCCYLNNNFFFVFDSKVQIYLNSS